MRRFFLVFAVTGLATATNIRSEPKAGVRIYAKIGNDIEVGIAHPSDLSLAAGVAEHASRAARAHLSKLSGTGMTGSSNAAATGPVDTFDYQGFSDKVDDASEAALQKSMDATSKAVDVARQAVLEEHGLTTGGANAETGGAETGGAETGGAETGGAETGAETGGETGSATGSEEEVVAASGGRETETETKKEETGAGATAMTPEELVHKLRKEAGQTGLEDATGSTEEKEETGGETGSSESGGATGDETGSTGSTGSASAASGSDGHWKWIKKSHSGSTTKRHAEMVQ